MLTINACCRLQQAFIVIFLIIRLLGAYYSPDFMNSIAMSGRAMMAIVALIGR